MSKIKELMAKHCPNGVKFKTLDEVCEIKNGYTPSKSKAEFWDNGTIPWFRMEDIRKNGRVLNDSIQHITPLAVKSGKLFPANSIIISTTATIGEHALITKDFLCNQQLTVLSIKDEFEKCLNYKYLFYYSFILGDLCRKNISSGGFPIIGTTKIKSFPIPIPPRQVQDRIVDILDNFTELEAEMEVEMEARQQQYTYYLNYLFSFNGIDKNIEQKNIEQACIVANNKREPIRSNLRIAGDTPYYGANNIQDYVEGYTHEGNYVLIAEDGSVSIDNYSIQYTNGKFWANNHVHVIQAKEGLNNKFLFYYLKIFNFRPFLSSESRAKLTKAQMIKISIPIPHLREQERIVDILDKFDLLVNDISDGIPAEITARRLQYEYYRNQLLTFEEAT